MPRCLTTVDPLLFYCLSQGLKQKLCQAPLEGQEAGQTGLADVIALRRNGRRGVASLLGIVGLARYSLSGTGRPLSG